MCKFRKTLFTLWNDGPEPGPAVRQAPHDTRQHNVGISHSVARSFFVAARAALRTGPSETKALCKQYLMRHGIRGPSNYTIFRPTFCTRPTITCPRLRCRVEMHMLCICMRVCGINFRRTTDAIGRADRVPRIIAHAGIEFSTSRAKIYTRRSQTNRKNHNHPECVDVSPAPRRISSGQFCNSAIVRRVPVISRRHLR